MEYSELVPFYNSIPVSIGLRATHLWPKLNLLVNFIYIMDNLTIFLNLSLFTLTLQVTSE